MLLKSNDGKYHTRQLHQQERIITRIHASHLSFGKVFRPMPENVEPTSGWFDDRFFHGTIADEYVALM